MQHFQINSKNDFHSSTWPSQRHGKLVTKQVQRIVGNDGFMVARCHCHFQSAPPGGLADFAFKSNRGSFIENENAGEN
jgi:hypothetical protein